MTYGHLSWVETWGEEMGEKRKVEMWSFEDGCGTGRRGQGTQARISSWKKQSIVPYDLPLLEQFVPGQGTMIRARCDVGVLDNQ